MIPPPYSLISSFLFLSNFFSVLLKIGFLPIHLLLSRSNCLLLSPISLHLPLPSAVAATPIFPSQRGGKGSGERGAIAVGESQLQERPVTRGKSSYGA
ncbi:hypothetical protein SESBI_12639 [Sesbania bispinosa]|nr:hypothetical protein SESBI_12639 [Sesbania bispinosa]